MCIFHVKHHQETILLFVGLNIVDYLYLLLDEKGVQQANQTSLFFCKLCKFAVVLFFGKKVVFNNKPLLVS